MSRPVECRATEQLLRLIADGTTPVVGEEFFRIGAESYIAVPLVHRSGSVLGHLALIDVRAHILRVLEDTGWIIEGKGGTAARLGLNPSTLRYRLQKLGIKRSQDPP
jgi:transcriptional regulator with GAF, ATPase, and Fis domain